MLVLEKARLIFLANPKTATQSTRAMLAPYALDPDRFRKPGARHMGVSHYQRNLRAGLEAELGAPLESFAVMREPLDHLHSWYRYRQRPDVPPQASTNHVTFAQFVTEGLSQDPPYFAKIGRQAQFLAERDGQTGVEHLFDYARIHTLVRFLSIRLGDALTLPMRNVSPKLSTQFDLPEHLLAKLGSALAADFRLYRAVSVTGYLPGGRQAGP
jgi:hypothetical protein